jgi:hypothetical protein
MGLLDQFGNLTDDQSQGLLAAAASMLQQSGPSTRPMGIGQILGGGLSAYQDGSFAARKRKLEEAQAQQMGQLRGLQIQEAQGGLQAHQAALTRQQAIQSGIAKLNMGGEQPVEQAPMSAPMASAMPGGAMSPKVGGPDWMQQYQAAQPAAPVTQAAPRQQQNSTEAYANRLMQEAAVYSQNGDFDGADKRYQAAVKLMPQVDKIETAMKDGKPVRVITFKDGTEKVSGFDAKPDMVEMGLGNRKQWVDKNTVTNGQQFNMGVSPDTVYSGGITMRGQNMTDRRAAETGQTPEYKQDADGNWLALPKKVTAGQPITAQAVYGADGKPLMAAPKPLTESQGKAALFAARMDQSNRILDKMMAGGVKNSGGIKRFAEGAGNVIGLGTDSMGGALSNALGAATNWTQSDEQQQVEQAKMDFLAADLRLESGAAIGKKEIENGDRQYFPQPGDSDAVLAQKSRNRAVAIKGMGMMAGPGAAKMGIGASAPAAGGWSITKVN